MADELMPHQQRAIQRALDNDGRILLAHPMGSGKTRTSVEIVEALRKQNKAHTTLAVVPASLRSNYLENGIKKYTKSRGQILGSLAETHPDIYDKKIPKSDYYVVSYDMFKKDPQKYIERTKADTMVVDEMHNFRTENTANYKQMKAIRPMVKNFIGLTGTPFNNTPSDIRPLIDIVSNGQHRLGKNNKEFEAKFMEKRKDKYGNDITTLRNTHQLGEELNRWTHYTNLKNVLKGASVPKKIVENVDVEMSPIQRTQYNFVMNKVPKSVRNTIRDGLPVNRKEAFHILPMLTQARAVSNSIGYLNSKITPEQAAEQTPKMHRALSDIQQHLSEHQRGQVVVHSHLVEGGTNIIGAGLRTRKIPYGEITGHTKQVDRDRYVKDYNSGKLKVMVLSSAGTTGINLPNTTMHVALDGHYNPAVTDQIEARGIRAGGQKYRAPEDRHVLVRRYRSVVPQNIFHRIGISKKPKTVDEWIHGLAENKNEVNNKAESLFKAANSFVGYHYAKDGKHPDNILNYSKEKQDEILQSMKKDGFRRGSEYINTRAFVERRLQEEAKGKLGDKVLVTHPLYFRVDKDPNGWSKDYSEFKIDPKLLSKSTYTVGDSFDYLRKFRRGSGKSSLRSIIKQNLLNYSEIKNKNIKEIMADPRMADRRGGNYIEGQLWVPHKVEGNMIVEDK